MRHVPLENKRSTHEAAAAVLAVLYAGRVVQVPPVEYTNTVGKSRRCEPAVRTRTPRRGGAGGRGPSFRANAPQSLRLAGASERITSAAQIDPLAAPRPFPSAHTPPRRPTQERATGTTPRTGAPVAGRALAARRPRVQLAGRSETRVAPRDTHTRHTHTDPFSCLRVSRLPPRSAQVGTVSLLLADHRYSTVQ